MIALLLLPALIVQLELQSEVVQAIDGGRDWLVAHQNPDGGFGSHRSPRPIEILATVPGSLEAFQVATSALCVMALDQCVRPTPESAAAASRGIDFLLAHKHVRRPNGMEFYNTWALGYGLQCFGEWLARHPEDERAAAIKQACQEQLDRLPSYQILDGGFSYLDFDLQSIPPSDSEMSFTTATVLIGVDRALKLGALGAGEQATTNAGAPKAPAGLVEKAVTRLAADQTPEGSFLYGRYLWQNPRHGINQPKGSACRTPGNLYALDMFGRKPKPGAYAEAVDNLAVKYVGFQQIAVRRPIPHESWYSISGYFYLFGFYYASLVLDEKLTPEEQQRLFPPLARGVLFCRQPDGSFWDYPLYDYHYQYGTAFALLALSRAPEGFLPSGEAEKTSFRPK